MAGKIGDGVVSIYGDVADAMALFNGLDVNRTAIQKKILSSVGTGGRQAIRKAYRSLLKRRTGTLYKSIKSYVRRNGSAQTAGRTPARAASVADTASCLQAVTPLSPRESIF